TDRRYRAHAVYTAFRCRKNRRKTPGESIPFKRPNDYRTISSACEQSWFSAIGQWTKVQRSNMSAFGGENLCGKSAFAVAIGGKADMTYFGAYVCFSPKAHIEP